MRLFEQIVALFADGTVAVVFGRNMTVKQEIVFAATAELTAAVKIVRIDYFQ